MWEVVGSYGVVPDLCPVQTKDCSRDNLKGATTVCVFTCSRVVSLRGAELFTETTVIAIATGALQHAIKRSSTTNSPVNFCNTRSGVSVLEFVSISIFKLED